MDRLSEGVGYWVRLDETGGETDGSYGVQSTAVLRVSERHSQIDRGHSDHASHAKRSVKFHEAINDWIEL